MNEYPETLTFDEFDKIPWESAKQFSDEQKPIDEIILDVKIYAKRINGQIYTQVDGETDMVYSKGMRFVNRTGIFEVVKIAGLKVDNS